MQVNTQQQQQQQPNTPHMLPTYSEYPEFSDRLNQISRVYRAERARLSKEFQARAENPQESADEFVAAYHNLIDALKANYEAQIRALHSLMNVPVLQRWEAALDQEGAEYIFFHDENATPDHHSGATIRQREEDGALVLETVTTRVFPDTPGGRQQLRNHLLFSNLYQHTWEAKAEKTLAPATNE